MLEIWGERFPIKSNKDNYTHIMVSLIYNQSERAYILTTHPVEYSERSHSYRYPSLKTIIGFDKNYKTVKKVGRRSKRADSDASVLAMTYAPEMVQETLKHYSLELKEGE